jgi:hypothetical protein
LDAALRRFPCQQITHDALVDIPLVDEQERAPPLGRAFWSCAWWINLVGDDA